MSWYLLSLFGWNLFYFLFSLQFFKDSRSLYFPIQFNKYLVSIKNILKKKMAPLQINFSPVKRIKVYTFLLDNSIKDCNMELDLVHIKQNKDQTKKIKNNNLQFCNLLLPFSKWYNESSFLFHWFFQLIIRKKHGLNPT